MTSLASPVAVIGGRIGLHVEHVGVRRPAGHPANDHLLGFWRAAAQRRVFPAAALGGQIFAAAKGDLVSAPSAQGDAILIAQVNEITQQDPQTNPQLFEQARQITSDFLAKDMVLALQQHAVRDAKVKTNEKLRRTTLGLTDPAEGEATP